MKPVAEELGRKGHHVVIVIPEANLLLGSLSHCKTKTYSVPYTKQDVEVLYRKNNNLIFNKEPFWKKIESFINRVKTISDFITLNCESLLYSKELLQYLKDEKFDAVFSDPLMPSGAILAEYLSVPSVFISRGIPCGLDVTVTQCPSPPSYIPRMFSKNTDLMTFSQRALNFIVSLAEPFICDLIFRSFNNIASNFFERSITFQELLSQASLWLMRYDFTFEFPRPLMPNMVLVGGINCVKKNPLPLELEIFANSSGEHGFLVFTLGSLVSEIPHEQLTQIVEAFRRIPQKVFWRYSGPMPQNLSENVKIMNWLPQNDLLGHPKVKAFITHGGIHGIFEGICSGVPLIMMPLFGDQPDNGVRMSHRGTGIVIDFYSLTTEKLLDAIDKIVNIKSYKENMATLSKIHKDRPIEPLDLAVHWIEFVMEHKGAEHLRPAAHHLNRIQYQSNEEYVTRMSQFPECRSLFDLDPTLLDGLKEVASIHNAPVSNGKCVKKEEMTEKESHSNDHKSNLEVVAEVSRKMQCSACQCSFDSRQQQVEHYKTDWHRKNLRQRLEGKPSISAEEFKTKPNAGDLSSIYHSNIDNSPSDEDGGYSVNVESAIADTSANSDTKSPAKCLSGQVLFQNSRGQYLSFYRCILLNWKDNSASDVSAYLRMLTKNTVWVILMTGGGHFAGAVFQGKQILHHKTFHRYTVRAKCGKAQVVRDSQKHGIIPKSAGATLRRYNETALAKDIHNLLQRWSEHLKLASIIFLRASSYNQCFFFGGKTPALKKGDPRIQKIPFPSLQATFRDTQRVHCMLSTVHIYEKDIETSLIGFSKATWKNLPKPSEKADADCKDNLETDESTEDDDPVFETIDVSVSTLHLKEYEIYPHNKQRKKKKKNYLTNSNS
ncbi:UD11 glucuronosyltransferase, partial [Polypterus senegalus]|nr:UD11 glucuronosyltransferase [Polypterus senegalus]